MGSFTFMADRGDIDSPKGGLGAGKGKSSPSPDATAIAAGFAKLPGPMDFSGVLAIADSLPVMIAYLDREQRYVFLNRTRIGLLVHSRR